jgi:hypothetical protein
MVIADIKAFFDILNTSSGWLQKALGQAKRERERKAAQLLHDALILVASMRSYDNAFRPLLGRMLTFVPSWTPERRQTVADDLVLFLDREEILPHFRQAYGALDGSGWQGDGRESLDQLLRSARRFQDVITADSKIKGAYTERQRVIVWLLEADRDSEAYRVREWAEEKLGELDRRLLVDADEAFATLRRRLIAEYHLPNPGFAVGLPRSGGAD